MKSFVLISAICLQLGWSNAKGYSTGAGAFSYQDSTGTRYGGTYGLKDGEVVDAKGTFPPDFKPARDFQPPTFDEPENFLGFFPEYFRNLENLLQDPDFTYYGPQPQTQYIPPLYSYTHGPAYGNRQYGLSNNIIPDYSSYDLHNQIPNYDNYNQNINRAFQTNLDSQRLAMDAAHKAFDLTSNQAGISQNLNPSRLGTFNDNSRFGGFPGMPQFPSGFPFSGGLPMPNFEDGASKSSAFAGAAVGPGYNHQVAAINPQNPVQPNVVRTTHESSPGGYKSVSVSSYSSSSDINGRKTSSRGADTMVNDNGKISGYSVRS